VLPKNDDCNLDKAKDRADDLTVVGGKEEFNCLNEFLELSRSSSRWSRPVWLARRLTWWAPPSLRFRACSSTYGAQTGAQGLIGKNDDCNLDKAKDRADDLTVVGAPHMVGATVTALSRLFFDFQTQLQPEMLKELVETQPDRPRPS
jgi:hypothetical protein